MTKRDLLKRLEKMDDDKVVILVDDDAGWANLEDIIEDDCTINLTIEKCPIFSSD